MVGRLITSAICCLSAGSMKGLSQSLGLTSVVRASAAPALGRVSSSRSLFSIGRRPIVQRGCAEHPRWHHHCGTEALVSRCATQQVRAATVLAASTSQPESLQRKVSHILVKPDQEHILDEIEERLAGGEDFRMLAGELSDCRGSRMQGGEVGWIKRGQTTPMFEQAAFEADIGELVRVETQFGLHLIKVQAERQQEGIKQMSVSELADILQDPAQTSQVQLVDVREQVEERVASVPQFQLKPLSRMREWGQTVVKELDPAKHTIVMCHHGMRSQQAAEYLQSLGFAQLSNVEGGIHAYSMQVDPTVPTY